MNTNELFLNLFDNSNKPIAQSVATINQTDTISSINLSTILSHLINNAGRWCLQYASDVLYDIDALKKSVEKHVSSYYNFGKEIYVFGFRTNGVDHGKFVKSNIESFDHIDAHYICVLAVQIEDVFDENGHKNIHVTLKDITDAIKYLQQ